ncbi:hypothetical protein OROMI_030237 [Orobanche minor]
MMKSDGDYDSDATMAGSDDELSDVSPSYTATDLSGDGDYYLDVTRSGSDDESDLSAK